ncbi:MAG: hypothetical protein FWG62_05830 [Proteobacteria bacterium]|nr:hypothetical protein [Pseudomonadota bacterium]
MRTSIARHLTVLGLIAAFLAGCADKQPSGRWAIEPEVQSLFESGQVLPDHSYYYIGSSSMPDSIIAIDHRFTLRTRVWAEIDLTESKLNGWLHMFSTEHYSPACSFHGGVILTPDGQRAGYWYSRNMYNLIYMPEPGVLEVYQPHSGAGLVCGQDSDKRLF